MVIPIRCPCCKQRLFDLETAEKVGGERINIKCQRCKRIAVIQLKNFDRTEQMAAQ